MVEFRGSKTEQNLINAFAGESQGRNKYTFFSKVAKNEGYEQIAQIFLDTAENEKEHGKLFYKLIGNTIGHVESSYPFEYGTTEENLEFAVKGEQEEADSIYLKAENDAKEEGFKEIENLFHRIREIETRHSNRYAKLLENIKNKTVFTKTNEETWICRKCGYPHKGKSAPKICPCCSHEQAYFELLCEKY